MPRYEEYRAQNGEPDDHAKRDEIIAGFTGAIADRVSGRAGRRVLATTPAVLLADTPQEFETKGLDWLDRDKVVADASQQVSNAV